METVAAIIPVHNRPQMLGEALESVRAQSLPANEIIVVDDGSEDESAEVARSFAGVQVIRRSQGGAAAARNTGICAARSSLVAFLDADDLWHRDKLRIQTEYMYRHPHLAMCHTDEIWIRRGRRVNPRARHRKRGGRVFHQCLDLCFIALSTAMLRRDLFASAGLFDESLPACEDYDLWLRVSWRFEVGFIAQPLTTRREGHPGQLSHTIPHQDALRVEALIKLLHGAALAPCDREAAVQALERKAGIVLRGLEKKNEDQQAERMRRRIKEAVAASPGDNKELDGEPEPGAT